MGVQKITAVIVHERSTELHLACGHDRSIGGHVMPDGTPTARILPGHTYDCNDGFCRHGITWGGR